LRSDINRRIEAIRNRVNWILIEMSVNRQISATSQAPTPKKKIIRPGMVNSARNIMSPAMNHISSGLSHSLKFSILILSD
jgi:hypothetical protein